MERLAHAVPGVVAHDAVAEASCVALDRATDDVDFTPRGDRTDAARQRLAGAVDEVGSLGRHGSDREGSAQVAVHPVFVGGDVDLDDVAVDEGRVVGDAVADHLVDRGADRLRKPAVAERRRVRVVLDQKVVPDGIQFIGRDAGADAGGHRLDRLSGDPAGGADALDLVGGVAVVAGVLLRGRATDVLGSGDAVRNGAQAVRRVPGSTDRRHPEA